MVQSGTQLKAVEGYKLKKLTKQQQDRREELAERLDGARAKLEDALAAAIAEYNVVLAEAHSFAEAIANIQSEYVGERSDRWTESDAGEAYDSWQTDWDSAVGDMEEVEVDVEAVLSTDHANVLRELATEPEA